MTTMDQIHRIRELFYEQGKNLNCKFCSNGTPILKTAVHPF